MAKLAADAQFGGEISTALSDRVVHATDNSIFELMPQGIIYCRSEQDIIATLRLLDEPRFRQVTLTPRGGGTSTNGQSLGMGLVLDTSKYMTQIIETTSESVRLQSGVVLDRLNHHLNEVGMMFGPTTSSSSRVCLGGMINTDASGIGSMVWGKTSDHIRALRLVVRGGEVITIHQQMTANEHPYLAKLVKIIRQAQGEFHTRLPQLPRFFSGYNLLCSQSSGDLWNLVKLIAGSEGTLGVVSECTVQTVPMAKQQILFGLLADDFETCLQLADDIREFKPYAMELIDENILMSAQDELSTQVPGPAQELVDYAKTCPCANVLFVSFQDHGLRTQTYHEYDKSVTRLKNYLQNQVTPHSKCAFRVMTSDPEQIKCLWNIRKKSVGLYARKAIKTGRRGGGGCRIKSVAFVEDCAVHPRNLTAFMRDFRQLLDGYGLSYGMYGHLDAGCVHVRPQMDYADRQFGKLVRRIADDVYALTRRYGGVMWGEHGKGFRCEHLQDFLGDKLYDAFCHIKQIFDPHYQLNPGRICPPAELSDAAHVARLHTTEHLPLRAHKEAQIQPELSEFLQSAMACDGNGLCFGQDQAAVMCPSYQATRERVHSPKGRAALARSWLHAVSHNKQHQRILHQALANVDIARSSSLVAQWQAVRHVVITQLRWLGSRWSRSSDELSPQVHRAFAGCLSCKGCTRGCPLHVDIPEVKSRFLYLYHQLYSRAWRDYGFGMAEWLLPRLAAVRWLRTGYHYFTRIGGEILASWLRVTEFPQLYPPYQLSPLLAAANYDVIVVGDLMSRALLPQLTQDAIYVLRQCGQQVGEMPYRPSGKSWHSLGFVRRFRQVAATNLVEFRRLHAAYPQAAFVALDPGIGLAYRQEYAQLWHQAGETIEVRLLQEHLITMGDHIFARWRGQLAQRRLPRIYLLVHCFEKSALSDAAQDWLAVFKRVGITVEHKQVGCCGMAGFWGYQVENKKLSTQIFNLAWWPALESMLDPDPANPQPVVLVTGGSCRHQLERCLNQAAAAKFSRLKVAHPVEYLAELIRSSTIN